jgi:glycosyltransferase involved in cell wall biosynthesis
VKTLLLWSGAVVPAYRPFFQELGKYLRLKVLGPRRWTHGSKTFENPGANRDVGEKQDGYEMATASFWPPQSSRYLVPSLPLHLWRFRPRYLYIMDEMDRINLCVNALIAKIAWPPVHIVSYSLQNLAEPTYYRWHHRLALFINRRLVSRVAAASREAAEVMTAHGYRGPMRVIPLCASENLFKRPTDLEASARRRARNFPEGALVLLYAGSLVEAKGLLLLAKVLPRFPHIRLLTAGQGPLEVTLGRMLGHQWNHLGALEGRQLVEFYQSGEYVILPSLTTGSWKEQIGRTLIEGILCGCIALGSDSGHIPELTLAPEATFRQGDAESLAALLARLPLAGGEVLRANQFRNVSERFTSAAVARDTWEFLADGSPA